MIDGAAAGMGDEGMKSKALFENAKYWQTRAEAAEARAADLQTRLDAMHSEHEQSVIEWETCVESNRKLREANDALREGIEIDRQSRNKTLSDILAADRAIMDRLSSERDAFAAENEAVHLAVNEMCGTDTSTIEAVQIVISERDELARQLDQAQAELNQAKWRMEMTA